MTREEILVELTAEIVRLETIRGLLVQSQSERFVLPEAVTQAAAAPVKRTLSPEARKRIALAQKRRWAKQHRERSGAPGETI